MATCSFEQRGDTRYRVAAAHAQQTLLHENAVVVVQRHNIGHCAQCNQVKILRRYFRSTVSAALFQHAANPGHEVERNSHAGQVRTRELAVLQVRVDDDRRRGKFIARQMMVRHQHRNPELPCLALQHPFAQGELLAAEGRGRRRQDELGPGGLELACWVATLETPLSTVIKSDGERVAATRTISGVNP